jgi:hypothetical protein
MKRKRTDIVRRYLAGLSLSVLITTWTLLAVHDIQGSAASADTGATPAPSTGTTGVGGVGGSVISPPTAGNASPAASASQPATRTVPHTRTRAS